MKARSAEQFRKNALLTTIAHAVWIVPDPILAYERQWVDGTYCVNNSAGVVGAAYVIGKEIVGAIFDENSPRNPLKSEQLIDPNRYLTTLPLELHPVMTLHAMALLPSDPSSAVRLKTAAFWQVGDILAADEPWEQMLEHGGRVFHLEFLDEHDVLRNVQNEFQFSEHTMNVVQSIYQDRLRSGGARVQINVSIWESITQLGHSGIDACRSLLEGIGIYTPS